MNIKNCIPFLLIFFAGFVTGCDNEIPHKKYIFKDAKSDLSADQTTEVATAISYYYWLKDALVAANKADADESAGWMKIYLKEFRSKWNKGNDSLNTAADTSRQAIYAETDSMLNQLDLIISAKNEDCELKRIHFKPLSDELYRFVKNIHLKNIPAYRHYCPMAMNEQGAYWLSASPKIENPYFGQKMLTCGELVDTIH